MMQVILTGCPAFLERWQAFQRDWADDPEPPLYIALGDFARHLVLLLERGDIGGLEAAFEAIERLHTEGEHYVREAATIGILEALQNENLHSRTAPRDFERYLRPESRRWWAKLNQFWAGDASALADPNGAD